MISSQVRSRIMPTGPDPLAQPQPGLPSLDAILAGVRQQTEGLGGAAPQMPEMGAPQRAPATGLSGLLSPYTGTNQGAFSLPNMLQMTGQAPAGIPGALSSAYGLTPGGFGGLSGTATSGTTSIGPPPTPYNGPIPHSVVQWESTFSNGQIPNNALITVPDGEGGSGQMMPIAGAAWETMRQAAARDGVQLAFGGSYRPYDQQVALAQQKGLYSQGGLAAVPGTSEHGWGLALDMNLDSDPRSFDWLQTNGAKFGFHNIPREPWHWQFEGGWEPAHRPTPLPLRPSPQPSSPAQQPRRRPDVAPYHQRLA